MKSLIDESSFPQTELYVLIYMHVDNFFQLFNKIKIDYGLHYSNNYVILPIM